MTKNKKALGKIAKSLFKKSLTNGNVDDKKVLTVLKELSKLKPAGLSSILKTYKRFIVEKLSFEEIILETNDKITLQKSFASQIKKKTGAIRVINKTNPNIVFGAKITHGDWIFDETLENKLKQLMDK